MKVRKSNKKFIALRSLSRQDLDIDSDELSAQVKMKNLENNRYESDTKDGKWLAIWLLSVLIF
jgi:hypothetical protein